MNYEDVCKEAGVDPSCCNGDMRVVITYMVENVVILDGVRQEIKNQVHVWNWNHTIFDIYDEIKGRDDSELADLLNYVLLLFKDNAYIIKQVKDLVLHLNVDHLIAKQKRKDSDEAT